MTNSAMHTNGNHHYLTVTSSYQGNARTNDQQLAQQAERIIISTAALEIIEKHGLTDELKKKVSLTANQNTPGTDRIGYPREGSPGI